MGRITATCVTRSLQPRGPDDPTPSGIDKAPVDGLRVRRAGAVGDQIIDTAHHGGVDKALYAYADEDAAWWADELGETIDPGRFGENLRTEEIDLRDVVIGTRLAVGDTVVLEVTEPRVPCTTFQHHLEQSDDWIQRFTDANRTGAYLRVLTPGPIAAGDAVEPVHVPDHGVTVAGWFGGQDPEDGRALLAAAEADETWTMPSALRGNIEWVLSQA